ncbi:MAG: phosphatase PAP2 family protein [Acidimicrobiia bacterium]
MPVSLVVALIGLLAAVLSYAVSRSDAPVDPIDPAAEVGSLVRRIRRHPKVVQFVRRRLDRSTASGLALTLVFGAGFTTALVVGSLLDMVDRGALFARLDRGVATWGATNVDATSVRVLKVLTDFGASRTVLAVGLVAGVAFSWQRRRPGPLAFFALVVVGQWLLANSIKLAVGRDRPAVVHFVNSAGSSFPSGHTTAAAATWAAIALALGWGRSTRVRAVLGAAAGLIAAVVAATRALLGAHWLTDVLAGLALGWGWFLVVAIAFGGRALRAGAPAESVAGRRLPAAPGQNGSSRSRRLPT